ncbi:hypothetical protein BDQ17DRAFT_1439987 [Cyathus striatus]|nr:hypothetical protein BDQ17DRAFT_1439987 [Cyathus striatus]
MPIVQPGEKVLVTGANGYLGIWTVQRLLDRGYSVCGTVRSESKGAYPKEYSKSLGDRFEVVIVSDFTKEGAFDESLVGVSGVLHVAAPLPSAQIIDPDDYIKPAVEGILSILKSSLNLYVRIVYTSTVGAIMREVSEPTVLSEKDWNDDAVKVVEDQGKDASTNIKYFASKVIAEKASWDFYEKHKKTSPYDYSVILPLIYLALPSIYVLGADPSSLGVSLSNWYNSCVADPDRPREEEFLARTTPWADVRDLADAHITALEKEEASGERIIVSAGEPTWQQWIDAANEVQSSISPTRRLPKGKPGIQRNALISYDGSKEKHILGIKFRDIRQTSKDSLELCLKNGW